MGWQVGYWIWNEEVSDQQIYAHNIFAFAYERILTQLGSFAGVSITNLLNHQQIMTFLFKFRVWYRQKAK